MLYDGVDGSERRDHLAGPLAVAWLVDGCGNASALPEGATVLTKVEAMRVRETPAR